MQKTNSKSSKITTVKTYELRNKKWEILYSEKYKKLDDTTFSIRGSGDDIKGSFIRRFKQLPDNSIYFKDFVKDQLMREGSAKSVAPLFLHGSVTDYYPGGDKKSVSVYSENQLVSNENWLEDGTKYIDNIFYSADVYPTFSPGNLVLRKHILAAFKKAGIDIAAISGTVTIGFVVMENGTIDGIRVVKGLGPSVNAVAYDAFKTLEGSWTPAKLNNQTVKFFQSFPINFIYREQHLEFAEMRGAILHFGAY
jgi:hypothetical protein